ncbi:hypothetical protein Vretimale_17672 [Volvox reticuliferus]|uniref:Uncharacterized protein n=1 Tax=Volvox reticuliferus TaxID=1737510 RepID=A0A8J4LY46_9CHLO|nr:hypothetical protein Vretimale_17672 [Volvox reticuliferus]
MEPYKLTTNRAPLSETLGPPGFHPLLPGKCSEDCLTAHLAEHGYKDELPQFKIDDTNDSLWSLSKVLVDGAVVSRGEGPAGGGALGPGGGGAVTAVGASAPHPLAAAAFSLQRATLSMLAAAQRQRLDAEQVGALRNRGGRDTHLVNM